MEKDEQTTSPTPPSIFQDCKLITKEHYTGADKKYDGLVDSQEVTKDRVTALYFSASWCPPCQQFTPMLKDVYAELRARKAPFEIIFISFDRTTEAMKEYYLNHHGDWLMLPYDDPLKEQLVDKFNITAIPKLIVLRPDEEVITFKGRKEVQEKGMLCFRGWFQASNLSTTMSLTKMEDSVEVKDKTNEELL